MCLYLCVFCKPVGPSINDIEERVLGVREVELGSHLVLERRAQVKHKVFSSAGLGASLAVATAPSFRSSLMVFRGVAVVVCGKVERKKEKKEKKKQSIKKTKERGKQRQEMER